MSNSFISVVNEDSIAIVDSDSLDLPMEPEKTIYDLRVINLKEGEIVTVINDDTCNGHCLIIYRDTFCWVFKKYLTSIN